MKIYCFLPCAVLFLITQCAKNPKKADTNKICDVCQSILLEQNGFMPSLNVMVDPSSDYFRFYEDEKHVNTLPFSFSLKQDEINSKPCTIMYCPRCEAEFQKQFHQFRMLSEDSKNKHFEAILMREAAKNNDNYRAMNEDIPREQDIFEE